MAKFRPTLGELSGSVGNVVFSHNKGGAYSRRRAIPTNPNTVTQQTVRQQLSQLSRAWASLTTNQRTEWTMWAAEHPIPDPLGNSVIRSGQQCFVGLNIRNQQCGQAIVNNCPVANGPASLLNAAVVWTAPSAVVVTFTATPLPAGIVMQIWGTIPASAGRSRNYAQARLLGISAAADTSPVTIASRLPALTGQTSQIYLVLADASGQAAPPLRVDTTVV